MHMGYEDNKRKYKRPFKRVIKSNKTTTKGDASLSQSYEVHIHLYIIMYVMIRITHSSASKELHG